MFGLNVRQPRSYDARSHRDQNSHYRCHHRAVPLRRATPRYAALRFCRPARFGPTTGEEGASVPIEFSRGMFGLAVRHLRCCDARGHGGQNAHYHRDHHAAPRAVAALVTGHGWCSPRAIVLDSTAAPRQAEPSGVPLTSGPCHKSFDTAGWRSSRVSMRPPRPRSTGV